MFYDACDELLTMSTTKAKRVLVVCSCLCLLSYVFAIGFFLKYVTDMGPSEAEQIPYDFDATIEQNDVTVGNTGAEGFSRGSILLRNCVLKFPKDTTNAVFSRELHLCVSKHLFGWSGAFITFKTYETMDVALSMLPFKPDKLPSEQNPCHFVHFGGEKNWATIAIGGIVKKSEYGCKQIAFMNKLLGKFKPFGHASAVFRRMNASKIMMFMKKYAPMTIDVVTIYSDYAKGLHFFHKKGAFSAAGYTFCQLLLHLNEKDSTEGGRPTDAYLTAVITEFVEKSVYVPVFFENVFGSVNILFVNTVDKTCNEKFDFRVDVV